MKNVLIVANLAGFASFLLNDMKTLQEMGYQITFAANSNKLEWSDTKEKLDERGITFIQIDFDSKNPFSKQNLIAYKQIRQLLKLNHYDLIHCHTPIAGLITRLAANKYRRKNTKVIYTTHGFAFTSNSSKKSWFIFYNLEKFGSRFCDAMITINLEDFQNAKRMHCRQVYYIHGVGVDTSKYREVQIDRDAYRKSIGVDEGKVMILSVGELSVRKNHRIIIEAISKLPDKEKFIYVVCGNGINGGTKQLLKELANQNKVNLKLLGFRHDIPEITYCSDVGAIPSLREGLGLAGVQSLAAGVPIVGSDVQGIRDYVQNKGTGYLCAADDANGFASAILKLSQVDEVEKRKMQSQCYEVASQFDTAVSRQEMVQIYKKVLGRKEK